MMTKYIIEDYRHAIGRERAKRASVYPKIYDNVIKNFGADSIEAINVFNAHQKQNEILHYADVIFENHPTLIDSDYFLPVILIELVREYNMRKKCYPRWVYWYERTKGARGISPEIAQSELQVWQELVEFFNEHYAPSIEIKFLKTKAKLIYNDKERCHS